MLVKFKPDLTDVEAETERQKYHLGTRRSIAVIAMQFDKGRIWVFVDQSSDLLSIPLQVLDVVDNSLSACWRLNVLANDAVLLGPPLIAQEDFEVDASERPPGQAAAYEEVRRSIFAEAEQVDPEAWNIRES